VAGDQNKFQTAMMHADRFNQEGKWTEALRAYRFAIAEFPNNPAAIIGFGKAALSSGNTDLARKAFVQVLKINPTNLKALSNMGDIQERAGQLDAAAETYLKMGNVYASRNDLDTAIDSWIRATRLASGQVDAYRKLADALVQQGKIRPAAREFLTLAAVHQRRRNMEQALENIEMAAELLAGDPGVIAAFEAMQTGNPIQPNKISDTPPPPSEIRVDITDQFGDEDDPFGLDDLFGTDDEEVGSPPAVVLVESAWQGGMQQLANLVFEGGDEPGSMLIMQAIDLQSRDDVVEAIKNYQQAIDSGANHAALYFNLGLLYRQQGQLNEAAKMLKVAAQDDNYNVSSHFALGETYQASHDLNSAVEHFVEALKLIDMPTLSGQRSYEVAQTYSTLTDRYDTQSDPEKTSQFITALQNFFSDPEWEKKVYQARQRMNRISNEGHTMSLAEYLETPETEVVVTTLATTGDYMSRNMLLTASEECLRAIQQAPSFLPLHNRLADILLKQKCTDEAITKYLHISRVFQMRGQPDQTVSIYHKILNLAPMDVTVRSKLIDMYISFDDIPQALEQYLILADSYYQLAQVDRALEKYNEALRLDTDSDDVNRLKVEALTRMADIYSQRFDWAGASSAYEALLQINPTDEHTLRELIDLYYKQNKTKEATNALDNILAVYQRQSPLQALALLKEFSSIYPDNMFLRQRLAVAYAQSNMTREAIAEYDKLGEMQMENGLREQAIQTIQAIINLGPDDLEGYRRLLAQIGGGT
jgi:tetratricopeptide (TPR) repeat protein